jgi:hypothetical protein
LASEISSVSLLLLLLVPLLWLSSSVSTTGSTTAVKPTAASTDGTAVSAGLGGRLAGRLPGRLGERLTGRLAGWLAGWLTGRLTVAKPAGLGGRLAGRLAGWLAGRLAGRLTGVTQRPNLRSAISQQGLGDRFCWAAGLTGKLMADGTIISCSASGLDGSKGVLLVEIWRSGLHEDNELQCRLLPGDREIMSVSVSLLV